MSTGDQAQRKSRPLSQSARLRPTSLGSGRSVPRNASRVTGVLPVAKGIGDVEFESGLEEDFLTVLGFSHLVLEFKTQPCTIHWRDAEGRRRRYTPDVLARVAKAGWWRGRQEVLFEVKAHSVLKRHWSELRPKYKAATAYARERGWVFKIVTEQQLNPDLLWNIRFLNRYRLPGWSNTEFVKTTFAVFERRRSIPVRTLVNVLGHNTAERAVAVSTIWSMVANYELRCDLSKRLTMSTRLWRK